MINFNTDPDKRYPHNADAPVEAIYNIPDISIDRDNMFIAALPKMLTDEEADEYYYEKFPGTITKDAPRHIQKQEIALLDLIYIPLDYCFKADDLFHQIITNSYRKRYRNGTLKDRDVVIEDEDTKQAESMRGLIGKDGYTGMALLGVGGTGKSSLISRMLERYPQVIIHNNEKGQTVQIAWLYVMALSRHDLNGFMNSIAEEIDKAIMNSNEVYSKKIRRMSSLGEKAKYIAELFKLFNVGALIIDEIQEFDVFKNHSESYETLMTIIDLSKVAIFVCGTEEAYNKFFYRYYVARRIGEPIRATQYTRDFDSFKDIFNTVTAINWFKYPEYPSLPSAELEEYKLKVMQAFHYVTGGVIERIILLWQNIQKEYIDLSEDAKKKFVLSPEVIEYVSRTHAPLMALFLNETIKEDLLLSDETYNPFEEKELLPDTSKEKQVKKSSLKGKADTKLYKSIEKCRNPILAQTIFDRVSAYMETGGESYSPETIISEVIHIMGLPSCIEKSEDELVTKTIKTLHKHPEKQQKLKAMQNEEFATQDLTTIK